MRDILFKAKRIDNQEWIEGYYVCINQHHYIFSGEIIKRYNVGANFLYSVDEKYEVDPKTICQYTGLTDTNGKKIFEWDLLYFKDRITQNNWLCIVEFFDGNFVCRYIDDYGKLGDYEIFNSWHKCIEYIANGNIFYGELDVDGLFRK